MGRALERIAPTNIVPSKVVHEDDDEMGQEYGTPVACHAILHLGEGDQRSLSFIHRVACEESSAIDLNIVSPFWFMHSGADHLRAAADDDVFMSSQVLPT